MREKSPPKMDVKISQRAKLPTRWGDFTLQTFSQRFERIEEGVQILAEREHLAIFKGEPGGVMNLRIHSECLTGDTLGSLKCDCGEQLGLALAYIQQHGGMVLYLRQEGRGIGLGNKINAYALQDQGLDTIAANEQLGFAADERSYEIVDFVLDFYGVEGVNLLSNNPAKLAFLGDRLRSRVRIRAGENDFNASYLRVKKEQMGHLD